MASPNAILVDTITVEVANMGKVSSRRGVLTRRTPAEYRGDRELVKMKGIPDLFDLYHEVLWEAHRFGIRSEAVTEAAPSRPTQAVSPVSSTPTVALDHGRGGDDKKIGTVKTWMPGKGFGFVTDAAGEGFHFSRERHFAFIDEEGHPL